MAIATVEFDAFSRGNLTGFVAYRLTQDIATTSVAASGTQEFPRERHSSRSSFFFVDQRPAEGVEMK